MCKLFDLIDFGPKKKNRKKNFKFCENRDVNRNKMVSIKRDKEKILDDSLCEEKKHPRITNR